MSAMMSSTPVVKGGPGRVSEMKRFVVLLLLAAGVQLWIGVGRAELGERRQMIAAGVAMVIAVAVMKVGRMRGQIVQIVEGIAYPSRRSKVVTALSIMVLSCGYLYATARFQGRDFSPVLHDEYSYLLQAKMLAGGHLWLPKHELADFFETFHVVTDRVYAAKYGPGTAMFYVVGVWMHWPGWVMPLLLSGMAVGLMYLLGTELFDGRAGWVAAVMLVSLGIFRRTSIMIMSQAPMLVLVLVGMIAFVYWRRERRMIWMVVLGVAMGWGAITRPVDAVCVAGALGLGVLVELWKGNRRDGIKTVLVGLIAVLPFLVLQLVYNKGVTGKFTVLPWSYYAQRYDPYDSLSRKAIDPAFRPMSVVPQVQQFYDEFTLPEYRKKLGMSRKAAVMDRAAKTLAGLPLEEQDPKRLIYGALPSPILIVLLPVGIFGLCCRGRWALWVGLPAFLLLYASYTFFLPHYAVAIVPVVVLLVLGGMGVVERGLALHTACPRPLQRSLPEETESGRARAWHPRCSVLGVVLAIGVLAISISALPELDRVRRDQVFDAELLRRVDKELAAIQGRAIVLFKFDSERNLHEEPVYNVETAWPDDARVIRAHDLGEMNSKLDAYYAAKAPERMVYRFDEKDESLKVLGKVGEMAPSN